jgi:dipeptidyl aminopeptidase/acylaminoacyl peptidase
MGGRDLQDQVDGSRYLQKTFGIDPERVGMYGGSYGGFMTMSAITKYPQRWTAAVAIYPMVDLSSSYDGAREDMRQFQARNIGTPEENPQLYEERSPINFVERITCPLLILQGDRDPRCRLDEVQSMCQRLHGCGREFELVVYEHEGHGFARLENRLDSMRRTADFFDKHLARTPALAST